MNEEQNQPWTWLDEALQWARFAALAFVLTFTVALAAGIAFA